MWQTKQKEVRLINPLTGRQIQYGGATHRKLLFLQQQQQEQQHRQREQRAPRGQRQSGGSQGPEAGPPVPVDPSLPLMMPEAPIQRGKTAEAFKQEDSKFYSSLLQRTQAVNLPPRQGGTDDAGKVNLPQSKYMLISSALPPAPETHSWSHHHAPFAQTFGDYVCLKRETLRDLGGFIRDAMA